MALVRLHNLGCLCTEVGLVTTEHVGMGRTFGNARNLGRTC